MKTIITTNEAGRIAIVKGLTEIFGSKEENKEIEKTYSLGFVRLQKLSNKKRLSFSIALQLEGFGWDLENHNEQKRRLSEMTEEEFKAFKK